LRDEEQRVAAEAGPTQATGRGEKSEEQSRSLPLWLVVVAVLALGGVVELIIYGYLERPQWIGVADKKFWDFLDLLIVPAALALGVYWLNLRQEIEREATEEALKERDLVVENRRAQDAALQAYLDKMSQLLIDKERPLHRADPGDKLSTVARARTLTVLSRVDGDRKRSVLEFLYESGLVVMGHEVVDLREADLGNASLSEANLSTANLSEATLSGAHLSGADLSGSKLTGAILSSAILSSAILREAKLIGTQLYRATLSEADLSEADLSGSNLSSANLSGADLSGTKLREASLTNAGLSEATLSGADLSGASLLGTELRGANLSEADLGRTEEELEQQAKSPDSTPSLEGATMPNGYKYEEWLKAKEGRRKDGENSGPS